MDMETFGKGIQQHIMYAFFKGDESFSRCSGKIIIQLPNWPQQKKQDLWLRIREETEKGNLGLSAEAMCDDRDNTMIAKDENSIEIDTHHFFDVKDLAAIIHRLFEMDAIPVRIHGMNMCHGNLDFIITKNERKASFEEFLGHFRGKYGDYFKE